MFVYVWQGDTEQKMLSADFLPPRQTWDHIRLHWEEQNKARAAERSVHILRLENAGHPERKAICWW